MQTARSRSKPWLWIVLAVVAVAVIIGAFMLYHGGGGSGAIGRY
ncbi:MAG: hypothetical protein QOH48_907 [Actinomycetota bacterium]|jgi:hypothetical protein|nr:hypothetical protein [Actinomycetota bacterium]